MFDTIGRDTDDEAPRRRAKAMLLTLFGVGTCSGLLVGVSGYLAAQTLLDIPALDEVMVELLTPLDPALEAPPPPPPAGGRADAEPDEPPDVVRTLEEPTAPPLVDESAPQGTADGVDGGDPQGVPGGVPGGFPGATGTGSGGPVSFHHTELTVKRRVYPDYPDAALALSLGEQRCLADVILDETGTPVDVVVTGCPAVFDGPTREALFRWRWYPPRVGSRAVQARTTIAVTYSTK